MHSFFLRCLTTEICLAQRTATTRWDTGRPQHILKRREGSWLGHCYMRFGFSPVLCQHITRWPQQGISPFCDLVYVAVQWGKQQLLLHNVLPQTWGQNDVKEVLCTWNKHSHCKECFTVRLDIPTFPLPGQNKAKHHSTMVNHIWLLMRVKSFNWFTCSWNP